MSGAMMNAIQLCRAIAHLGTLMGPDETFASAQQDAFTLVRTLDTYFQQFGDRVWQTRAVTGLLYIEHTMMAEDAVLEQELIELRSQLRDVFSSDASLVDVQRYAATMASADVDVVLCFARESMARTAASLEPLVKAGACFMASSVAAYLPHVGTVIKGAGTTAAHLLNTAVRALVLTGR
jgi:hypothetical protein